MKQLTFCFLLTAILTALVWPSLAQEATQEVEVGPQTLQVVSADAASADGAAVEQTLERDHAVDLTALDFPLAPEFAAAEGGTCTPCSNHGQCAIACGGFGACLRDFGGQCGGFPGDKFCFC